MSTSSTKAVISVEHATSADESGPVTRAHASAYFIRLQAGADDALATRLVGASLELPALGHCEEVSAWKGVGLPLATLPPIDLVDVGEVSIETSPTTATLAPRAFPDVINLVAGVVYTTRDQFADPLPDEGAYVFRFSGSPSFPSMALSSHAPGMIAGLSLQGQAYEGTPLRLVRGDVPLTWQPGNDDTVVYVDIVSTQDGTAERVRCSFADNGAATLPARVLPQSDQQSIVVHRVLRHAPPTIHAGPLEPSPEAALPNLPRSEIRFDLAFTAKVRFESPPPKQP